MSRARIALLGALVTGVAIASCATPVSLPWESATPTPTPVPTRPPPVELVVSTQQDDLNPCFRVVETAAMILRLEADPTDPPLFAGDELLVMQVTDDFPAPSGQTTAFNDAQVANAGRYERALVTSVIATSATMRFVTLATPPVVTYQSDTQRAAQACLLPVFTNVSILPAATLLASPWNGTRGGVVGFRSLGRVRVDGRISASGQGFPGGGFSDEDVDGSEEVTITEDATCDESGRKGTGLSTQATSPCGRGSRSTAGGGANEQESGGGGGGNGGAGGGGALSDLELENADPTLTGGRGGGSLVLGDTRLTFGGGGGGGHGSAAQSGAGGAGGGIVYVLGSSFQGSGTIHSEGQQGGCTPRSCVAGLIVDGAGGGGAGGTIWMEFTLSLAPTFNGAFAGQISIIGGAGGLTLKNPGCIAVTNRGGGGGGGGRYVGPEETTVAIGGGKGYGCNMLRIAGDGANGVTIFP